MLVQNIDTIAVCELRRGFALQCFHLYGTSNTIIMNIIICSVYSRAAFNSLNVALWGSVYSRAIFISLDVVLWGGVYSRASFIQGRRLIE